jgi:hypothetical protein
MSKILRAYQKIFGATGLSGSPAQFKKFGGYAASDFTNAPDSDVMQSLGAFDAGWFNAITAGGSPLAEDMNSLHYVITKQIAYLMQTGVPEWDATTTYYIGSFASVAGVIYVSLTDTNLNHAVTDAANWTQFGGSFPSWSATVTYAFNSLVAYNGKIYRSKATSNINNQPDSSPGKWYKYKEGLNPQGSSNLANRCLGTYAKTNYAEANFVGRQAAYAAEIHTWVIVGIGDFANPSHSIEYSTNGGASWTNVIAPTNFFVESVCWSAELGLFVAVCQNAFTVTNVVYTSPDGITWTGRNAAIAAGWNDVIWVPELGLFVAVGATTVPVIAIMTSPDGTNWTSRTAGAGGTGTQLYSSCYSPELNLLVAVGSDYGPPNIPTIQTSPDGITWTNRTPVANSEPGGVTWIPEMGLFIIVGAITFLNPSVMAQISYDGITWTALTIPMTSSSKIALGTTWIPELGELLIGYGEISGSTDNLYHTRDLVNFTQSIVPFTNNAQRLTWCPQQGQVIALGNNLAFAMRSKFVKNFTCPAKG